MSKKNRRVKMLLLADGWPSLSLVLSSLGFDVTTFVLNQTLLPLLSCLPLVVLPVVRPIHSNSQLGEMLQLGTPELWIQINSSQELHNILKELDTAGHLLTASNLIAVTPTPGRRSLSTKPEWKLQEVQTSHQQHGGITMGRWTILMKKHVSGETKDRIISGTTIRRQLRHVLDFTNKGICHGDADLHSSTKRRKLNTPILKLDDQVIPGISQLEVITPSVKQPYDLVRRALTPKELMDVYDLQTPVQSKILTQTQEVRSTLLTFMSQAIPEKVVYSILSALEEIDQSYYLPEKKNLSTKKTTDTKHLEWLKEEEEAILNDEKAARDDDVEIQTQQWDQYLMRSFNSGLHDCLLQLTPVCRKPMVCTGQLTTAHDRLFTHLRWLSLRRFRRNVYQSFLNYMQRKYKEKWGTLRDLYNQLRNTSRGKLTRRLTRIVGKVSGTDFLRDLDNGREAVERALHSSFWDWDQGSSLFFWRWPSHVQPEARDGVRVFITGKLPRYKVSQRWPHNPTHREAMIKKWLKVIGRGYVKQGGVSSLTGSFAVPKGESDIRMVYDATKCGLNSELWAPNYILPTVDVSMRQADSNSWFGDIDLGEQFLNFALDENIRPFVGIDITHIKDKLPEGVLTPEQLSSTGRVFLRWERTLMGLKCSPYNTQKMMAWLCDIIRGDPKDPNNIFRWSTYNKNCPGCKDYDPSRPWGCKWRVEDGVMAVSFEIYVDDIRTMGNTEEECVRASRRVASICNYYGVQDAARKRRFPSQRPSVWCGAKVMSTESGLYTSTTQEKWDKGKEIITRTLGEMTGTENQKVDRKSLERGRGFLVHLARTYPGMTPFLKGIHNTLEMWRDGRDEDGWKFGREDWENLLKENQESDTHDWKELQRHANQKAQERGPPSRVPVAGRLKHDLTCLGNLMHTHKPPLRLIRGNLIKGALYSFGDASGSGFGSMWGRDGDLKYRFGIWDKQSSERSSNFRELCNLRDTMRHMHSEGLLNGLEIFMFTDNSTAEAAFYKGSSTSELLHSLVAELRTIELDAGCKLNIIHVSGDRMKNQGSDGLSRGNMLEGSMTTRDILEFVPIHKNALQCEGGGKLLAWLNAWVSLPNDKMIVLRENDWFARGQDVVGFSKNHSHIVEPIYKKGTYLWTPCPAMAEIACEAIRHARNKCQRSCHVLVVPRLMMPHWRRHLYRAADLILEIPPSCPYWPNSNFEPLIIAIFLPFIKHRPWQLKRSPVLIELERVLSSMWKRNNHTQSAILCQLRSQAQQLDNLSPSLVHQMLQGIEHFGISYK